VVFNSWIFVPFILVVLALYYVLPFRAQNKMLLVASYVFYGAWNWRFLGLLWLSTLVDYFVARTIDRATDEQVRKRLLVLSCVINFGILGVFKYFNFFEGSAVTLLGHLGIHTQASRLSIVLPLGISFYTFETVSYSVDVYRKRIKPEPNILTFALFLAYFPHLVAGPIVRAWHLIPQLNKKRTITGKGIAEGLWLILFGLFKKTVIADNLAIFVDQAFNARSAQPGAVCLLAVYAFAIQIYCDFSGYSDIARGLAKLMGIDIPKNFNLPYLSTNPAEFWQRWHISLSTWLRDYVYIPVGGNRGGRWQVYRNLMITMVLGGLWHGAAWTFVIWGAFQGVLLVGHRWWTEDRVRAPAAGLALVGAGAGAGAGVVGTGASGAGPPVDGPAPPPRAGPSPLRRVIYCIAFFQVTCFGWLLFRARNMDQVGQFLTQIFGHFSFDYRAIDLLAPLILFGTLLWMLDGWVRNADDPRTSPGWYLGFGPAVCASMVVLMLLLVPQGNHQFIYFQF
jgi:alginate O-acetyltransferase complex protein AlgI